MPEIFYREQLSRLLRLAGSALAGAWFGMMLQQNAWIAATAIELASIAFALDIWIHQSSWTWGSRKSCILLAQALILAVGAVGLALGLYTKQTVLGDEHINLAIRYAYEFKNHKGGPEWIELHDGDVLEVEGWANPMHVRLGIHNAHNWLALENARIFVVFQANRLEIQHDFPWQVQLPNQVYSFSYRGEAVNAKEWINATNLDIKFPTADHYDIIVTITGKGIAPKDYRLKFRVETA